MNLIDVSVFLGSEAVVKRVGSAVEGGDFGWRGE